ncbi:hypothetical protein M3Y98_00732500 [Aphelenchoides besseyi]|nr:hypothetical protein M3Y98_00732500 [Aphelenchoides besseyi]KAI6211386.1 hypothetical protein M3Y96_00428800 [Aphelenchoides besseyi]
MDSPISQPEAPKRRRRQRGGRKCRERLAKQKTVRNVNELTHQKQIKTKKPICSFWLSSGFCRFGSSCRFIHVDRKTHQQRKYRTRTCNFYETGICPYGERCYFIHDRADNVEKNNKVALQNGKNLFKTQFLPANPPQIQGSKVKDINSKPTKSIAKIRPYSSQNQLIDSFLGHNLQSLKRLIWMPSKEEEVQLNCNPLKRSSNSTVNLDPNPPPGFPPLPRLSTIETIYKQMFEF